MNGRASEEVTFEHPDEVRVQPFEILLRKHARQKEQQVQKLLFLVGAHEASVRTNAQVARVGGAERRLDLVGHGQDFISCSSCDGTLQGSNLHFAGCCVESRLQRANNMELGKLIRRLLRPCR